jgi:peroxiredoxin
MRSVSVAVLCLTVLLLALLSTGCDRSGDGSGAAISVGQVVPDFTLKDMDGRTVTLSQYRGKVVFLNFWATWCPPCREEMPAMERLNTVFQGQDFVMLAVNVEKDIEPVRAFLAQSPHSFAVLLDQQATAQNLYGVFRFPETFLIDQEGRLVERFLGARDWSSVEFMKRISTMMGQRQ